MRYNFDHAAMSGHMNGLPCMPCPPVLDHVFSLGEAADKTKEFHAVFVDPGAGAFLSAFLQGFGRSGASLRLTVMGSSQPSVEACVADRASDSKVLYQNEIEGCFADLVVIDSTIHGRDAALVARMFANARASVILLHDARTFKTLNLARYRSGVDAASLLYQHADYDSSLLIFDEKDYWHKRGLLVSVCNKAPVPKPRVVDVLARELPVGAAGVKVEPTPLELHKAPAAEPQPVEEPVAAPVEDLTEEPPGMYDAPEAVPADDPGPAGEPGDAGAPEIVLPDYEPEVPKKRGRRKKEDSN